jgi:hypothetical protein
MCFDYSETTHFPWPIKLHLEYVREIGTVYKIRVSCGLTIILSLPMKCSSRFFYDQRILKYVLF